ncbi:hypothetical protein ACIBEK_07285 [Nocardia fusca]|uniref:hypothetical protein n=1 Tax=Nocardia fusca TaxID=941183 RepID=UPI0037B5DBFF
MNSGSRTWLHRPLLSRRVPLDSDNAASRISAYIYGNILVLTALVPVVSAEKYVGILLVLGTALSTFIAHSFAETVGDNGNYLTRPHLHLRSTSSARSWPRGGWA